MSSPSAPVHTAFRYMSRFRCIGGECESSCCTAGWQVGVDREHYEKTKRAMNGSPQLRREFGAKVTVVKAVTDPKQPYALMVLQDDGSCGFFGVDKMCGLQKRYGEAVLSDTCTIYPRTSSRSGARLELAGATSCPEVARQLLLYPDALELDEVPASLFHRSQHLHAVLSEHPADPYTRYHDELRNLVLDLLSDPAFPLSTRLSFVAYFARQTRGFLYRGVAQLDEQRLLEEIEAIQSPAMKTELHKHLSALPVDHTFASSIVLTLLSVGAHVAGFRGLLDAVVDRYTGASNLATPTGTDSTAAASALTKAYEEKKEAWAQFAPRIDSYLTNYAKNYWAREWYVNAPDLLTHTLQLLLRIATLRFLLFGHPLMTEALTFGLGEAERELALSRATVQTVQQFSRAFEHSPSFALGLQQKLSATSVISWAHATCLARF